jgi:hypothetical protein
VRLLCVYLPTAVGIAYTTATSRRGGQTLRACGRTGLGHHVDADANEVIAPVLGLADLSFVDWPDTDDEPETDVLCKTLSVTRWLAGSASGSTTKPPTPTDDGSPRITHSPRCYTMSIHTDD